jgi:ribosome-binding factor A
MSIRSERIGEQIRQELSRLLRDEVSDPRIGLVSLTRVAVAPDLSTAGVFWSPLDIGDSPEETAEKDLILSALDRSGNNITRAAEALGISRRTLHRKLNKYRG